MKESMHVTVQRADLVLAVVCRSGHVVAEVVKDRHGRGRRLLDVEQACSLLRKRVVELEAQLST